MTPNLASPVDVERISSLVHRRCGNLGVNVVFDIYAKTAYTNGQTITFPSLRHPISQDQLDILYGYAIHETGHHLRPEAFKILRAARPPGHLCALFNIIEDDGMERERAQEWKGDKLALSTLNNLLIQQVTASWKPALEGSEQGDCAKEPLAVLCLQQWSRLQWDTLSEHSVASMIKGLPEEVRELATTLEGEGWVKKFRATRTVVNTWDLAVDLAKRLYPGNDDKYEELRRKGASMQQSEQDGDNAAKALEKDKGNEGVSAPDPDAEGSVVSWKDVVLSEHTEWKPLGDDSAGTVGIDWAGKFEQSEGAVLMPLHMINLVDVTKNCRTKGQTSHLKYLPKNVEARQFANRVRRYLQAQVRSKVDRHKYHGRLDKSSIVKLALPPINKGDYNKKIFYEQERAIRTDTAIFVLTDWSGSMNGSKKKDAADASQRLVYTMERVLHTPVALACFTNGRTRCDIGYIKPFGTRGLPQEEIAKRLERFDQNTSANNDADALNWAYHELKQRRETRKMLIVLSDGCPAGSWGGRGSVNLKFVTAQIEKQGKVELYGVGIHSNAVKEYYTNYRVLNSSEQINETLFNLIKAGDMT